MTSTQFQTRYTDPTQATPLPMPDRAKVAGALFVLQNELRLGRTVAGAMATVTAQDSHNDALTAAAGIPGQESVRTDFLAISGL